MLLNEHMRPRLAIAMLCALLVGCSPSTMTGDWTATLWGITFDDIKFTSDNQVVLTGDYKGGALKITGNYIYSNDQHTLTMNFTDVAVSDQNQALQIDLANELQTVIPAKVSGDLDMEVANATFTPDAVYPPTPIVFTPKKS